MYRVLIVEDEYWMREGLRKIMNKLDMDFTVVDIANNGNEAIQKLKIGEIDLVISDIRMPIMDGLDLMKEMATLGFHQPVIIITGHSEFEYARTAFRLGAVDYLLKPIKSNELRDVLHNLQEQLSKKKEEQGTELLNSELTDQNKGAELIRSILKLIETSYMDDLSLAVIADQAGFNASYLSRLFKMETGKGFVQYLREVRMKHACQMLITTGLTIEHIANKIGFMDEKHFRRTFKKEFGLTPGEYRKEKKGK